jgi:hypothetical protein
MVPGGQLTGARYLKVAQLALALLTASRVRQRELSREIADELELQRRWETGGT